jgi:hypothetical protein
MNKRYRIEWYRPDGTIRTHTEELVYWGKKQWHDDYRGRTFESPMHWFLSIQNDYREPGDPPPVFLEREIPDWKPVHI